MVERWKSFLDLWTNGDHRDNQRETEVSDDGASQQATAVVVAMDIGRHVHGQVGRPRHAVKEHFEPKKDLHYVEAEYERQRNTMCETVAVLRHVFELSIIQTTVNIV